MDSNLGTLKACEQLSLSTNCIEKINGLQGLDNLKVLSLGRNNLKKIENLEPVSGTLEQLWLSYNMIKDLVNVDKLAKLRVLYISNNKVRYHYKALKIAYSL